MGHLVIHPENVQDPNVLINICPFNAIELNNGVLEMNAACKMCKLCVRKGPKGAVEFVEDQIKPVLNKDEWKGICVYVDHSDEKIHPVTYELIGKAREMAGISHQPVEALLMGDHMDLLAHELLHYGVDAVYVYDRPQLARFKIEPYTAVFDDFIQKNRPSSILVGATTVGRQLAPRVAAREHTGLTADCTILQMEENTDLDQIRPAFGGNIMAFIKTPNNRPQMATVRYKIMNAPARQETESGIIVDCSIEAEKLASHVEVLELIEKAREEMIENAEVLVVAGRGCRKDDLEQIEYLAELLGGQSACTRPLVESGWMPANKQIGLSGRTVRPKLILTFGVSGAVQFTAGMDHSDNIFAINSDPQAPIFKTANYGLVGDLHVILPDLISKIEAKREGIPHV